MKNKKISRSIFLILTLFTFLSSGYLFEYYRDLRSRDYIYVNSEKVHVGKSFTIQQSPSLIACVAPLKATLVEIMPDQIKLMLKDDLPYTLEKEYKPEAREEAFRDGDCTNMPVVNCTDTAAKVCFKSSHKNNRLHFEYNIEEWGTL